MPTDDNELPDFTNLPTDSGNLNDTGYCGININDFTGGNEIRWDVYVRLSESKFLKIANRGSDLSPERIASYRAKNIRYLYITKENFREYIGMNLATVRSMKTTNPEDKSKKLQFLQHTGKILLHQIFSEEMNKEHFEDARTVVEATVAVILDDADMSGLLVSLNAHSEYLYAHSLGVSFYSVLLARQMKWTSPSNQFKASMGGLLHDIGKQDLDRSIVDKHEKELTLAEQKLMKAHPHRGVERLVKGIPDLPLDVLHIVSEHHENCQGTGYPGRLTRKHIHPLARTVAVADEFCELVLKNQRRGGFPPKDAIYLLLQEKREELDPDILTALLRVFKLDPLLMLKPSSRRAA